MLRDRNTFLQLVSGHLSILSCPSAHGSDMLMTHCAVMCMSMYIRVMNTNTEQLFLPLSPEYDVILGRERQGSVTQSPNPGAVHQAPIPAQPLPHCEHSLCIGILLQLARALQRLRGRLMEHILRERGLP